MLSGLTFRQKQILSIIFTFLVYTWVVNWQAAILLVVAIGFHESSHLWAAKKMGLRTSGFFLFPFMGGVALVNERYKTLGQQAFVVLLGPAGGGLLAIITAAVFHFTGWAFLGAAAVWMCYLNLFNLLPFSFMDGGQLLDTISYSVNRTLGFVLRIISTVVAAVVLFKMAPFIMCIVVVFGGMSLFREYNNWKAYRSGQHWLCSDDYLNPPKSLSIGQAALTIGGWLVTAVALVDTMLSISSQPIATITTIFH